LTKYLPTPGFELKTFGTTKPLTSLIQLSY
jgi:hypothetical protein